jgi:hypothetical protein
MCWEHSGRPPVPFCIAGRAVDHWDDDDMDKSDQGQGLLCMWLDWTGHCVAAPRSWQLRGASDLVYCYLTVMVMILVCAGGTLSQGRA